jgi:hypothetical protein
VKQRGVGHGRAAYRAVVLALLGAIALTGCRAEGPADTGATGPTRLTVREYDGERLVRTIPLDCAGGGETCQRVAAILPRLAPDPAELCAQIYGGPERRVVEGEVGGRAVRVEVTRVDGCQIARYDLLTEALG